MTNAQNEIWKDIEGYEGVYIISNLGRVKSLERKVQCGIALQSIKEKMLVPAISSGYKNVGLSKYGRKYTHTIHRLIAKAFIPNIYNKPNLNHIDGNKLNNSLDNLEWCTQSENVIHGYKIGLSVPSDNQRRIASNKWKNRVGKENPMSKGVISLQNGIYYESITEAANSYGLDKKYLQRDLRIGKNTNFKYI